jgi:hypothetical protein
MWTETKMEIRRGAAVAECPRRSLLDRIGWRGLLLVGWRSTPLSLRVLALPYTLIAYRKLLAASDSPKHLLVLHTDRYQSSLLFRALRPRFRRIRRILESFAVGGEREVPMEIADMADPAEDLLSTAPAGRDHLPAGRHE